MIRILLDFLSGRGRYLKRVSLLVGAINALEKEAAPLSDADLTKRSLELKKGAESGQISVDDALPEAFALVREAARRALKQRHFDVQLIGGIVLHEGKIAEMATGEGKTLAATTTAYLNALTGEGVHVVTVNDYLARRDAVWMGQIYNLLGMSVGCLAHDAAFTYDPLYTQESQAASRRSAVEGGEIDEKDKERDTLGSFKVVNEFLRPSSRKEAYQCDIVYGTNHEFGFDYLRDNLAYDASRQVQKGHNYAIIDEVDSILIDEARTPLIISAPDAQSSQHYKTFARVISLLNPEDDYIVEEKLKSVHITDRGIDKVEKALGIENIYAAENIRLSHYLQESLKAGALFRRDKEYVVKDGEVIIVDEFTGRLMRGRRYSGGLHQAIEAKEGVLIKEESRTYAQITIQNYFRLYKKISGMTGTAQTSAEEFQKVYGLEVVSVPPNRQLVRKDGSDVVYKTAEAKYHAVAKETAERHRKGQPVLLGTVSIEKNELLSSLLKAAGVPHEMLNAKNHEREGAIVAQAGKLGAVTVATNMAGRGVDIILGGNPSSPEEAQKIRELGGLYVIGTDRHEARRIDNQLRGRSGRQGDPGETRFYLSLEDDLLRIFGGDRIKGLMSAFNMPEDVPIESKMVSRAVNQAQTKVEGMNFDARKHLLDFDDVLNKQRTAVYRRRQEILENIGNKNRLLEIIGEVLEDYASKTAESAISPDSEDLGFGELKKNLVEAGLAGGEEAAALQKILAESGRSDLVFAREAAEKFLIGLIKTKLPAALVPEAARRVVGLLDLLWMEHLENMDALRDAVGMRAYAQHNPLVEYRREGHRLFNDLFSNWAALIFSNIFR
ncbi:MAG: preprotein translocase subunit SecA, partial [Parcubacteria group bacterium]|nr:preprotein translocase subunit SecA [Parcubacteria group bacterium]